MTHYLLLTPRDPLIARDGRPFGANQGNRMRSLDWPYPSVLAGSLRTMLGKMLEQDFNDAVVLDALKHLTVAGPLPWWDGRIFFPKPADAVWDEQHEKLYRTRPAELLSEEGTDLPEGIHLVLLPEDTGDFKPGPVPLFWSKAKMEKWLMTEDTAVPVRDWPSDHYLPAPEQDQRMHVKMGVASGAGEEGQLFMTAGLDLHRRFDKPSDKEALICMAARIDGEKYDAALEKIDTLHPFGGERRLVHWGNHNSGAAWTCPDIIREKLRGAKWVRLVLASPGIFRLGWKPDWPNGTPPGTNVSLKLVGAAVDRWQPLSGWSLEQPVGPKPIRRLVPAGSVFFFKVEDGDPSTLANGWLQSLCTDVQDRRDGFGLALWGTWKQDP